MTHPNPVVVSPDQPHGFFNSGSGPLRQIDIHLSPRVVTEWLDDPQSPRRASHP